MHASVVDKLHDILGCSAHDSADCVRLDDALAENVRAAATAAGINLSEWIRYAIRQQAALATALRARAEEDTGPQLYTDEQQDALLAARRRRAAAVFTGAAFDQR